MSHVKLDILILLGHMRSTQDFGGVRVALSLLFYVVFYVQLVVCLSWHYQLSSPLLSNNMGHTMDATYGAGFTYPSAAHKITPSFLAGFVLLNLYFPMLC